MSEFLESELYEGLRKEGQEEMHEAVLRFIIMRNEKVRRRDLSEEFVKGGRLAPNELTRILERLTYAKFVEREEYRTPVKVIAAYYSVHPDRVIINDCTEDMPAIDRVIKVVDYITVTDELEDHERDIRRVMDDLPPGEKALKAQLQDYLNRRRAGIRSDRKKKARNKKNRKELKR